jgi:phosphatidylglycerol---prolipoprotein diacylglyceryl transferase
MLPRIHVGPLTLQTFGICFALAFLVTGAVVWRRFKELGKPTDWAYELLFAGLVGGLIGARIDYLIENYDKVSNDLFGNLFSGSGLVWFGGFVGGTAGVLIWRWRRRFPYLQLLDLTAVPLAMGYAIGRIGCQLSGDGDYGKASDLPWAMAYPKGTKAVDYTVQPTPVYETLVMGLVALVLWNLRDRFRPGVLFAFYLVLAGLERLLVEFIRRNSHVIAGLTFAQLISIAMLVVGGVWLVRARHDLSPRPAT